MVKNKERKLTDKTVEAFGRHLLAEEKSKNTVEKYIRDVKAFAEYVKDKEISKETVILYKQRLIDNGYAVKSINSMLCSVNAFLRFSGRENCRVKQIKVQRQIFCPEEKVLTREEYERLCNTALSKQNERLYLILQTICGTGIRISELAFITVQAVKKGRATVSLKGKTRTVFIAKNLQKKLLRYIAEQKIKSGPVFVTKTGKPLSRTNVWREMKNLCARAKVNPNKVFPHNLRHLFARVFYGIEKDIVKLADVLGHSSIDTTRIYIVSSGQEHLRLLENMRLTI